LVLYPQIENKQRQFLRSARQAGGVEGKRIKSCKSNGAGSGREMCCEIRLLILQKPFSSITFSLEFCRPNLKYKRSSFLVPLNKHTVRLTNTVSKTFHHVPKRCRVGCAANEGMIQKFKCRSSLCWVTFQGSLQK